MLEVGRTPVMADVAARAGVSLQTVSRVVNDSPSVRPETRERVERAITDLGYRPNTAARALVTRRTSTLGVVSASGSEYGPSRALLGIDGAARAAGYSLVVAVLGEVGTGPLREAVEHLLRQSVQGVVVIAPQDAAIEAIAALDPSVPVVAVESPEETGRPTASVDQEAGARLVTGYLLGLGHATVHHVSGPLDWLEARSRLAGWRAELEAAGSPVPAVETGDWSAASGHAAAERLLARRAAGEALTAVFAGNDQMAVGVLRALAEGGLAVPGDVSVAGFDDVPEAGYYRPPLTTVRQDFTELGRRCVQALLARIAGAEPERRRVAPTLVVRASSGPPAARTTGAPAAGSG